MTSGLLVAGITCIFFFRNKFNRVAPPREGRVDIVSSHKLFCKLSGFYKIKWTDANVNLKSLVLQCHSFVACILFPLHCRGSSGPTERAHVFLPSSVKVDSQLENFRKESGKFPWAPLNFCSRANSEANLDKRYKISYSVPVIF